MPVEIFDDAVWQMSLGERAAVERMLAQLEPSPAIEIGSIEGACLRRIAAHAELMLQLSAARAREAELRDELVARAGGSRALERGLDGITGSASWRMTEPLRTAKRQVARRVKR